MRRHVDAEALVACARALVAVDTQNPPGNERAALDVARRMLEPFDPSFHEVEPAPGRTSLAATIGAADGSRPVLIVNGHLDVVPVDEAGWTCDPFAGRLDGDRLYGRGMADMKGGIASAVEALHVLRRAGRQPSCDVVFHLVADEERGGGLGTRALVEAGLVHGDACLVPEPTGMAVCVAERGLMVADVTVFGRPAHGSDPRRGVSAIEVAAKVVLALHAADFGAAAHPLLGSPTCNVGVIEGGSGHNTVAERCTITVDRRLLPGVDQAEVEAGLRKLIDSVDDADLRYELEVSVYGEASELDPSHGFVGQVQAAIAATLGAEAPVIGMGFTTDARFVRNQAGIPAVVCGPGEVSQAHVNDEWVSVTRLIDAAAVYAELFATFTASAL
ncbi:MAG TPA: M20 family metallopeptidase [Acidimicrobiales bacterium]|nr:M20 family metallopeptidase [Acidimicrobiales bacterium]